MPATAVTAFAKDHWSLLAYIETRCVETHLLYAGLDKRRMRCNPYRHPLLAHRRDWSPRWGTRLANGQVLADHDDWDCLDDLEAVGLVEILSLINGFVRLTESGISMCAGLRAHKINGGTFATFGGRNEFPNTEEGQPPRQAEAPANIEPVETAEREAFQASPS